MNPMDSKTRFPRYAVSCALALAGWMSAGPVSVAQAADTSEDALTAIVSYQIQDLATHEGNLKLYERIVEAGREVCPLVNHKDLSAVAQSRSCRSRAIAHAVSEINNPALAAVYAAHGKAG